MVDDEIYEDLRQAVHKICKSKYFLDSLQIAVEEDDFIQFLELFCYPEKLRH